MTVYCDVTKMKTRNEIMLIQDNASTVMFTFYNKAILVIQCARGSRNLVYMSLMILDFFLLSLNRIIPDCMNAFEGIIPRGNHLFSH